jgi:TolB-like protein/DNA-binding winged helix-turn-helix (wHTH) protein/Tfp pilus assembly protein PilF
LILALAGRGGVELLQQGKGSSMPELSRSMPRVVRFGVFEADLQAGELRKNGAKVKLEGQPFQILAELLARPGHLVTREELKQKLWPADTFVDFEHSLNAAVKRLRDALDDSADTPRFVETLPRRGYRFICPIAVPEALLSSTAGRWRWRWCVPILLALALGLNLGGSRDWLLGRPRVGEITSIAVLPLKNLSGDPEQDFLAAGMTEMLITELGKIGELRVISHQSVTRYRDTTKPLPEIAQELNVDAVLEGTVVRSGDRIRITANLVQAVPERHLFSESYERDMHDVFSVQGKVARDVASQINLKLTPQQQASLGNQRPVDPEAYVAYLRGRVLFDHATNTGRLKAKEEFEKAIQKDPSFARAYGSLAELYARGLGSRAEPQEGRAKARELAVKALELDDTLAEAHNALAWVEVTEWNWAGAEQDFKRAIELNPSYPVARVWYALYLASMQRFEEAFAEGKHAQQLNPVSSWVNTHVGWVYLFAGRTDEAMEIWREVLELEPNDWAARHQLGKGYVVKGMYQEAIAELQKAQALEGGDHFTLAVLAHAYGRSGQRKEALKLIKELERRAKNESIPPLPLAWAYAGLGDKEKAFAWLEKAYAERRGALFYLNVEPLFEPLRSDARFQDLVRRVGLPSRRRPPLRAATTGQVGRGSEETR